MCCDSAETSDRERKSDSDDVVNRDILQSETERENHSCNPYDYWQPIPQELRYLTIQSETSDRKNGSDQDHDNPNIHLPKTKEIKPWVRCTVLLCILALLIASSLFWRRHLTASVGGNKVIDIQYSLLELKGITFYDSHGNKAAEMLEKNDWGTDRFNIHWSGSDDDVCMECIYRNGFLRLRAEIYGEDSRIIYYNIETGLPEKLEETVDGVTLTYTFRQELEAFSPCSIADGAVVRR